MPFRKTVERRKRCELRLGLPVAHKVQQAFSGSRPSSVIVMYIPEQLWSGSIKTP